MEDLVTWLRAQLDEDERIARAADAGRWLPEDKGITFEYRADDFHYGEAQARLVADTRANQEHIAEWYPARVLREVEAKWAIVAETIRPYMGTDSPTERNAWLALRLLALPYADRPGYQESWRP